MSIKNIFRINKMYNSHFPAYGPKSINLWETERFYGKLDFENEPIILQKIKNVEKNIFLHPSAAEAFNQLKFYFLKEKFISGKSQEENILDPLYGYMDEDKIYKKYIEEQLLNFQRTSLKATSYRNFLSSIIKYITGSGGFLSKRNFIKSNFVPSKVSGLVLGVTFPGITNKYNIINNIKAIDNARFEFFRSSAAKFGFVVNRNFPNELIFNFMSDAANVFLKKEKGEREAFLMLPSFLKASSWDLNNLNNFLFSYYLKINNIKRTSCTNEVNSKEFLKYYFDIRFFEENKKFRNETHKYYKEQIEKMIGSKEVGEEIVSYINNLGVI